MKLFFICLSLAVLTTSCGKKNEDDGVGKINKPENKSSQELNGGPTTQKNESLVQSKLNPPKWLLPPDWATRSTGTLIDENNIRREESLRFYIALRNRETKEKIPDSNEVFLSEIFTRVIDCESRLVKSFERRFFADKLAFGAPLVIKKFDPPVQEEVIPGSDLEYEFEYLCKDWNAK